MLTVLIILILLTNIFHQTQALSDNAPIIQTKWGSIQGYSEFNAYVYLGIPYASPPLGDLRWADPIEPNPWSPNVLNATTFKPACPQKHTCSPRYICPTSFGEDCLYLNVYVPQTVKQGEKKAVMLFIHGGNFQFLGSNSPLFNGTYFSSFGDVIVVTINYRIGALGFLVTGLKDDQIHGNFGIKDQRLAIKWVYENIDAFYGDTDRITIFGHSAGAESVSIHLLSADMQSYFKNAIVMSSPMSIPFRNYEEMLLLYYHFNKAINCTFRDVACLRSKTIDEIVLAQKQAEKGVSSLKLLEFFEPWIPWIDGELIKGQLLDIEKWLKNDTFTLKPIMIGTLPEECIIFVYSGWSQELTEDDYTIVEVAGFKQHAAKVLERYPPDHNTKDQRNQLSTLLTKWVFSCSSRNYLEKFIEYAPQNTYYMYIFDFPLDFEGWDKQTYCNNRTCHGADMPYTFDMPDVNFTSNGHLIALQHIAYWSNYGKNQTPNSNETDSYYQPVKDLVYWPKYDTTNRYYIHLKTPANIIESNYLKKDCDFFDSIGYYY